MATFRERHDPTRLMWRRLIAIALLILIALAVRGVWGVYNKEMESRELKIEAQAKLNDLRKREYELRAEIANLKSDRGIEEELRERYDLAAEGEGVVVIVEPEEQSSGSTMTPLQRLRSKFSW